MSTALALFGLLYANAGQVVLIAVIWGYFTKTPSAKRLLLRSALVWAVILFVVYGLIAAVAATCEGNALYGYHSCRFFPDDLANASLLVYIVVTGLGALYAVGVFVTAGVLIYRRKSR